MGTYDTRGGSPISPDDLETPCGICGLWADDCTCPECDVCGVIGDPACINHHMPAERWPVVRCGATTDALLPCGHPFSAIAGDAKEGTQYCRLCEAEAQAKTRLVWTIAWKECGDCDGTGVQKCWPSGICCWKCGGVGRYQVARLEQVNSEDETN